jgi:hypothetical protein
MQARKFTKKLLIFPMSLVILLLILYGALFDAGYYPIITNSTSLDAKFIDYRSHKFKEIDVLSIGSSMNLNNLNTSEIKLPDNLKIYYNFGAWGLQISDTLYLVKYLTNTYKPKCVLLSSSVPDFLGADAILIPKYYELNLINNYLPYFYSKSNLISIINRHREYEKCKASKDSYDNLNFDESGGVALNIPAGKISKTRWNERLQFPNNNTEYQYNKLQELALYLKNKNITFIYAQAPIRKSLVDSYDSNVILQAHFNKCKSIIVKNGGHYVNLNNPLIFDDSLFVDQYHLSSVGSKIYTKLISANINELLKR